MGTRDEQKEKRREEILTAGLNLFVRKGYASTKVSDIAKEVGMSTGLMFHYFESKEKLYEELIRMGVEGPMGMMNMPIGSPIGFFEESAKQILMYIETQPTVANMFVLMAEAVNSDSIPDHIKAILSGFDVMTPTTKLIEAGQADGSIREGNPVALAVAFWSAIQGIAEELAAHPQSPCPEAEWIVDIIRRKQK